MKQINPKVNKKKKKYYKLTKIETIKVKVEKEIEVKVKFKVDIVVEVEAIIKDQGSHMYQVEEIFKNQIIIKDLD